MKIYKIAQEFQMVSQNPGKQNDPTVQLQNLQSSQQALQYFKEIADESEQIVTHIRNLESALGITDNSLVKQFKTTIQQYSMQTPAFNLLAQMNLISSIENLMNQNDLSRVETLILTNIQSISDQYKATGLEGLK